MRIDRECPADSPTEDTTTPDPNPEPTAGLDPKRTFDEASDDEVGEQLGLAAEHMRGLHVEPRNACWRCQRRLQEADASTAP